MTELLSLILRWEPVALLTVFLFQLVRSLRVLSTDGRIIMKERNVFGKASLVPMGCLVPALIGLVLIIERFPDAAQWILTVLGPVVLITTYWANERGIKAVLAFRDKQRRNSERRVRIAATHPERRV